MGTQLSLIPVLMGSANLFQFNFEFVALSQEKKKAVRKCMEALERKDRLIVPSLGPRPLPTGFMCFTHKPLRKDEIPRQSHWRWNQCNKQTLMSLGDCTLSFVKYNTRRSGSRASQHVRRKIWMFTIDHKNGPSYFLWCERGEDEVPEEEWTEAISSPPTSPMSPLHSACELPALSDLSWLRDFVDPCLAKEFGWTC